MEELSRQLVEMMHLQQTQKLELQGQNMERQKENNERQLQLKFVKEKQSKMQKELNKQREQERRGKKGIQRKNTGNADAGRGKIGTTNSSNSK